MREWNPSSTEYAFLMAFLVAGLRPDTPAEELIDALALKSDTALDRLRKQLIELYHAYIMHAHGNNAALVASRINKMAYALNLANESADRRVAAYQGVAYRLSQEMPPGQSEPFLNKLFSVLFNYWEQRS